MTTEHKRIDTDALKQAVSLVEVAQRYTTLTQISHSGESQGPCPLCGGDDRFHVDVAKGRFYCRQCYPRGGDVIDLVMRVEGVSFSEACDHLAGNLTFLPERPSYNSSQTVAAVAETPRWQAENFQDSARRTIAATQRRLLHDEGCAGQEYLAARGLLPATWQRYKLGYGVTFHPVHRQQMDAIFLPWLSADGKQVTAIQHRFLDPQLQKGERYSLKAGSEPLVFGLHALEPADVVVVVEGEFNCMAINQVGIQAISVGSESSRASARVITLLQEHLTPFERVAVWLDNAGYGRQLADRLTAGLPFRKEIQVVDAGGPDANDLLVASELADVVGQLRGV